MHHLRQRLEPAGRPAGDGARAPHRPDEDGPPLPARLAGHRRGADRAAGREEALPRPDGQPRLFVAGRGDGAGLDLGDALDAQVRRAVLLRVLRAAHRRPAGRDHQPLAQGGGPPRRRHDGRAADGRLVRRLCERAQPAPAGRGHVRAGVGARRAGGGARPRGGPRLGQRRLGRHQRRVGGAAGGQEAREKRTVRDAVGQGGGRGRRPAREQLHDGRGDAEPGGGPRPAERLQPAEREAGRGARLPARGALPRLLEGAPRRRQAGKGVQGGKGRQGGELLAGRGRRLAAQARPQRRAPRVRPVPRRFPLALHRHGGGGRDGVGHLGLPAPLVLHVRAQGGRGGRPPLSLRRLPAGVLRGPPAGRGAHHGRERALPGPRRGAPEAGLLSPVQDGVREKVGQARLWLR
mmetsp:Transcript_35032/g.117082  ORF Transcript_35032/g.117082 Transcript_35032/m.117082 type:complete len:406 (-) Transcript_35032:1270-2487(-)